jgi:hypothetical protein
MFDFGQERNQGVNLAGDVFELCSEPFDVTLVPSTGRRFEPDKLLTDAVESLDSEILLE